MAYSEHHHGLSINNDHKIIFFSPYFTARPIAILQGLSDQKVCEGDIVQLEVKVSLENVEGVWMKDGQEVQPSDRVHIVIDKQSHMLLIEDMTKEDAGNYSFTIPALGLSTTGRISVYSKCRFHGFMCMLSREVRNFREQTFETEFIFVTILFVCVSVWFCRC